MNDREACTNIMETYAKYKSYTLIGLFVSFAVAIIFEVIFGADLIIIIMTIVIVLVIAIVYTYMSGDVSCNWT